MRLRCMTTSDHFPWPACWAGVLITIAVHGGGVSGTPSSVPTTHVRAPFRGFLLSSVPCTHPPPLLMSSWPLLGDTQAEHQWTLQWQQQTYHGYLENIDRLLWMAGLCTCTVLYWTAPVLSGLGCNAYWNDPNSAYAWMLSVPGFCLCLNSA